MSSTIAQNRSRTCSKRCLKIAELLYLHSSHIGSVHVSRPREGKVEKFTENGMSAERSVFGMIGM